MFAIGKCNGDSVGYHRREEKKQVLDVRPI